MEAGLKHHRSSITHLSDDSLHLIFEKLDTKLDRESFGLTCHHFLDIQNSSLKCLKIDSMGCPPLSGFTNKGIYYIASGCPLLSLISLSFCKITDIGLKKLSKSCKYLKEVDLFACSKITDSGIQSLNQNCRQLRTLNIGMCDKITGAGFQGCSPKLACLKAYSCVLSSTGITEMLSGGGLEYLNFGRITCIGDNGLAAIGAGFARNLKILDFNKCDFVTDDVVLSISKGCPLLQEWNLSHCGYIGLLVALGDGCERLLVVSMKYCPQAFASGKNSFITQKKGRKILEKEVMSIIPHWAFARWP
ncbi:leucine-rich repeat domain, L domain-like protein [Artemisia annua]|uniref:Leucine-rich repeat domain, L domain-like protein n=1 Tax=Artemisia annua TaxID=35608 RepID=A0A2U1N539_ARTAN|nr:leucine-rich repeat domain, L domain-like protein [Artemisia annua]